MTTERKSPSRNSLQDTREYDLPVVPEEKSSNRAIHVKEQDLIVSLNKSKRHNQTLFQASYVEISRPKDVSIGEQKLEEHLALIDLNARVAQLNVNWEIDNKENGKEAADAIYNKEIEDAVFTFYKKLLGIEKPELDTKEKAIINTLIQYFHQGSVTATAMNILGFSFGVPTWNVFFNQPTTQVNIMRSDNGSIERIDMVNQIVSKDDSTTLRCVSTIDKEGNISISGAKAIFADTQAVNMPEELKKVTRGRTVAEQLKNKLLRSRALQEFVVCLAFKPSDVKNKEKQIRSYKASLNYATGNKKELLDKLFDKIVEQLINNQPVKAQALFKIYENFLNCDLRHPNEIEHLQKLISEQKNLFTRETPSLIDIFRTKSINETDRFFFEKSDNLRLVESLSNFLSSQAKKFDLGTEPQKNSSPKHS